ncbi:MAG: TrkA family potassium uptake protein [Actinobacteria bacterium]|nr:TrkA family potassium uptake protein [Actinomycetota bacterium]
MKVLIAGAGRLGVQIAKVFLATGGEVTIIERDDDRVAGLQPQLSARVLVGDACEPSALEEAGALTIDLLVAATGEDEDNLVISLLAKRQFAVPRVVARVNDSDNAWLFDHHWGVDVAVPAATPLITLIEEATGAADTVALLRLSRAGVSVIETALTPHSHAAGHTLAEIPLPAGTVVAAVIRDGQPTVPGPQFRLQPGDEVLIVSEAATEGDIHAAFQ